jgi:hypothetical protein
MPPPKWANPDQQAYLLGRCDAFIEAQKNKAVYKFWIDTHREWFEKWPEPGSEAIQDPDITEEVKLELREKIDKQKKVHVPDSL